jgi:hypothetical protein
MRFQFSRTTEIFAVLGVLFGVQIKALQASYDFIIVGGAPLLLFPHLLKYPLKNPR